jgi:hypothetical protein
MKREVFFLLTYLIISITITHAQENKSEGLLFEKYQEGIIYYKDGRQYTALLNYDVYGRRFLFVDTNDNNIKEFAEPHMVSLVKIGERMFIHDPKNIKEVVQMQPPILVEYRATIKDKGKNAGYGGRSSTAAISSYSGIQSEGIYHKFDIEDTYVISTNFKKTYYIEIDKKKKRFSTQKDFLKIYSQQKDTLKSYIKDNNIDFNSIEQVIQLCNYANVLISTGQ